MKKFLYKIAGFTLLLYSLLFLSKRNLPYYWGNPLLEAKVTYLEEMEAPINTLFIGNSYINRHVIPSVFDSLTGYSSFNLGKDGMHFLETQYIFDHLMKDYSKKEELERVFLPSLNYPGIPEPMLHTLPAQYIMDFKRLKLSVQHFFAERNYQQVYYYFISFVENQLCIGQVKKVFTYHVSGRSQNNTIKLILKQKGFLGLDNDQAPPKEPFDPIIHNTEEVPIKELVPPPYKLSSDLKEIQFYEIGALDLDRKYYFDPGHYTIEGAKIYTTELAKQCNANQKID